jgi:RNA polymerase sigma-54 factor
MQNMASRPQSLEDYLLDQVGFVELDPEEADLVRYLIAYVDENGYLNAPLEQIAANRGAGVAVEDIEDALRVLQKLDPPGVGARDLRECLLLQLTPDTPHRDVLRALIANHLEDIQHNRLPNIQRRTGFDLAVIKEAIEELRHLNPRPGAAFGEDGEYTIRLVDDWLPNVYISRRWLETLRDKGADPKTREYLKRKLQSAQWLLEAVEQRRATLEKVTRAIIEHQKAFLEKGPEYIEPLKMQQIADQVGVHVTTVSRAVDDKWVQMPRGVFPLKRFFGGGKQTATGEEMAFETIKRKLREIIDAEDKANPLSDEELVVKLGESGIPVARRTVTKYRKEHNIPSSRQRKEWTM